MDDDSGSIETFGALLRHNGYTVVAAFTVVGAETFLSLKPFAPEIVLAYVDAILTDR